MDLAAGVVGLLAGLLAGPAADRIATNAPLRRRPWASTPRSRRLAAVVAGTALAGLVSGLVFGFTLEALTAAVFLWVLVVVTRTDLEHRLIPDVVVLPGALIVLVLRTLDDPSVEWIVAALAVGVGFFLVALVYPSGIGMGDVKLSAFLGAGLGVSVVVAVFIGSFAAFLPAAILFARHGRGARRLGIPYGPFLALGAVVALFWGDQIIDWYRGFGS